MDCSLPGFYIHGIFQARVPFNKWPPRQCARLLLLSTRAASSAGRILRRPPALVDVSCWSSRVSWSTTGVTTARAVKVPQSVGYKLMSREAIKWAYKNHRSPVHWTSSRDGESDMKLQQAAEGPHGQSQGGAGVQPARAGARPTRPEQNSTKDLVSLEEDQASDEMWTKTRTAAGEVQGRAPRQHAPASCSQKLLTAHSGVVSSCWVYSNSSHSRRKLMQTIPFFCTETGAGDGSLPGGTVLARCSQPENHTQLQNMHI